MISLSCLPSPSFYPPSHYRYCICTQCIFYKYPLDVHSFKWGTVGFSEQRDMHFKSTNICLIFWFRFQHVRKELYSIMAGVVIQIQLVALERWKRVTHPAWGGQRKLDRGGNNIWGGPWREKCPQIIEEIAFSDRGDSFSKGMEMRKSSILGSELFMHRHYLPGQVNKPHEDYTKENLPKDL